jgi:arsenate reductase
MMCCDHADANCPVVQGAVARFAIHYKDPKLSDGTLAESATYDERSQQIAREMFYMLSRVQAVNTAKR